MRIAFRIRQIEAAILAGAFLAALACPARAADEPPDRPAADGCAEDRAAEGADAWMVSTRSAPAACPAGFDPDRFSYQRRDEACPSWTPADAAGFFKQASDGRPIVVFVHGNRADLGKALSQGLAMFCRLRQDSPGEPFRLVIWAWPADRVCAGPRRDALLKASRSDVESYYLARWLERLPPRVPVLLVGYSFGARVIAGALHLAEGGSLAGWTLDRGDADAEPRLRRVMLVAAALDSEWLLPGGRYGLALGGVDRTMITCNCLDPVLRLYPRLRRDDHSSALGFAGPAAPRQLAEAGLRLETVRMECQVGREHDWQAYLRSPAVDSRLARYAFLAGEAED